MLYVEKIYQIYQKLGPIGLINSILNLLNRKKNAFTKYVSIRKAKTTSLLFDQLFKQATDNRSDYTPYESNPEITAKIKLIAFYLPQFHPIPENDEWWGKGFTEWTNVSKAVPQFIGHYQPHLPGELGFYDLRLLEVHQRQVELARNYGIYGFCYYHYWFSGKKILELPFRIVLENPQLNFPFCLCWANENWTRRWDGLDNEILIKQNHSEEDDINFIKDIEVALRDKRYIRLDDKPLIIIYNIFLLPNASATAKRWRDYCISNGIGDLYLGVAQTFNTISSIPDGFDSIIEFPPHHLGGGAREINTSVQILNNAYKGSVLDYSYLIKRARNVKKSKITLLRTVVPSWDNEARKPGCGRTFINTKPMLYRKWLQEAISFTLKYNCDKPVFINAWNEWAEGAHLEPDRKYGYAWLKATYEALRYADPSILNLYHDQY